TNNGNSMIIRNFKPIDLDQILDLFKQTVNQINIKDYSLEQVKVWSNSVLDKARWLSSLTKNITYVAEFNSKIVGFGDMTDAGYVDRLYTHANFQGQGIGKAILIKLESEARALKIKKLKKHMICLIKNLH